MFNSVHSLILDTETFASAVNRILKMENSDDIYEIRITDRSKNGMKWFMPSLSLNGIMYTPQENINPFFDIDNGKLFDSLVGSFNNDNSNLINRYLTHLIIGDKLNVKIHKIDPITKLLYLEI